VPYVSEVQHSSREESGIGPCSSSLGIWKLMGCIVLISGSCLTMCSDLAFCSDQQTQSSANTPSNAPCAGVAGLTKRPVTVADSIQMTRFGDPYYAEGGSAKGIVAKFSPDGKQFVVVLKKGNLQDNTNEYSLILFRTAEAFQSPKPRLLLSMSSSSNRPAIQNVAWLNDNDTILFLGEHPGELAQIYSLKCSSGELNRLTNHPANLTSFSSNAKGDRVVYVAETPPSSFVTEDVLRNGLHVSHQLLSGLIKGNFGGEYSDHKVFVKEPRDREEIPASIDGQIDFAETEPLLSPDGKYFVVDTQVREIPPEWSEYKAEFLAALTHKVGSPGAATAIHHYELVDTHTGASQVLLDAPIAYTGSEAAWSPDSQSVVVSDVFLPLTAHDPAEQILRKSHTFMAEIKVPSREIIKVSDRDLRLTKWDAKTNTVVCEGGRLDSLSGKTTPSIYFRKSGDTWSQVDAPQETGATMPVIVLEEDMNSAPRIFAVDPATSRKSLLLDLNPQFRDLALARVEEVSWQSSLGDELKAGLYWPVDYVAGRKYPLVIQTHGWSSDVFWMDGPFASAFAAQPLAGKGFFVLQMAEMPNWHLEETPQEAPSAMAAYESAIDYLDGRGLIDRNLVGIIGFSRTCYYVTHTLVFSKYRIAAAVIADGVDMDYFQYFAFSSSSSGLAAEVEALNGGAPFGDALSSWIKRVSAFHMDQVQAPVRIQALGPDSLLFEWNWFSGLLGLGKPVDMVYLPDGTHITTKPWERMASQQGDVDWFCYWLKGEEDPDPAKAEQYRRWGELRSLNRTAASSVR